LALISVVSSLPGPPVFS